MPYSILSNTGIASVGRVANIFIGIAITAVLTRMLGASGYGSYALLISFGMIFQIAADFGLYLTLTRDIAAYPSRAQRLYGYITSLRLTLLVVCLTAGITIAAVIPTYQFLVPPLIVVAIGLAFQSLSQLQMGVYQTHGVIWRASIGDLIGRVIQLTLVSIFPVLIDRFEPLFYFSIAFTLGAGIAYLVHSLSLPVIKPWKIQCNWNEWKVIAQKSWPLGILLILNIVYFRVDIVMLSFWYPGDQVGWYGLAYRIIESGLFFPAMFGGLLLPRITAAITQENKKMAQKLLSQSLYVIIVTIPLVLIILVSLPKEIVVFLSGPSYAPAAPLLQILSIALVIMFVGNIFGFVLVSLKKQKQLLLLYLVLVGVNIAGNIIFIPSFAAQAAAWTTVATECVATLVAGYVVYRSLPFSFSRQLVAIPIVAVATLLIAFRLPTSWHVILQVSLIILFYIGAMYVSGVLRKRHINLLLKSS